MIDGCALINTTLQRGVERAHNVPTAFLAVFRGARSGCHDKRLEAVPADFVHATPS